MERFQVDQLCSTTQKLCPSNYLPCTFIKKEHCLEKRGLHLTKWSTERVIRLEYSRESNKRVEGITVHMRQFLLNLNSPILNNCPAYDILKNS